MRKDRRQFIAGLLATGLAPAPTWADAGSPSYLSAAALSDGTYALCGIDDALNVTFRLPLPARGHAAAAHPVRPEAVAFARRPGTFAVVIDCRTGAQMAMLDAPNGRHFSGHGTFSSDGDLLFTTENDYEAGRGVIGVWDVTAGYSRVAEWDSGGIGPHDIQRLPTSDILVVANGGIDTHPDTGRTKLNIPTMRSYLSYIADGQIIESAELPAHMHKNSIRHLAVSDQGQVAFGMQWQGNGVAETLVGIHSLGEDPVLMRADSNQMRDMHGYVGSIAFSADRRIIAVTSPRGGMIQQYDVTKAQITAEQSIPDVCGIAGKTDGFMATSGNGEITQLQHDGNHRSAVAAMRWDNHLVPV